VWQYRTIITTQLASVTCYASRHVRRWYCSCRRVR